MSNSSEDIETMLSWKEEEGMFIYATDTLVGAQNSFDWLTIVFAVPMSVPAYCFKKM